MNHSTRKAVLAVSVLGILAMSGCAQISVSTTVTADGQIEEYQVQINTSRTVYGLLESSAEEDGYDSMGDSLLADVNDSAVDEFTYNESFDGDDVTMTIRVNGLDPSETENISVTETNGRMVYEDVTFAQESDGSQSNMSRSLLSGLAVDYRLTMPGEMTNSTADEVNGDTAEWHSTGPDAFSESRIYAESDVSEVSGPGLAGFGFGVAILAVLIGTGLLLRRRGR